MASEEKDRDSETRPLPEKVRRALDAEAAQRAPKKDDRSSRWLAVIPVSAAIFAFMLMMPRSAPPEDVPLPILDAKALEATRSDDDRRAASVQQTPLDADIRAVGTAIRALNRGIAEGKRPDELSATRAILQDAMKNAVVPDPKRGIDALYTLRAVELMAFLEQVKQFEATGKASRELEELAGGFVDRMTAAGWIENRHVVLDEPELRVAYKLVWTATVGGDRIPALQLTLDEQRVLYTLYMRHPHAPEADRLGFEGLRRAAATPAECATAIAKEQILVEQWRAEKIKRFGEIDPSYPTGYALGVAYYRAGRYDLSMEQFRTWVEKHPDGPLALRARNHMKAAFAAFGPS